SVKSCTVLTVQAAGQQVTTAEGLGSAEQLHPVQAAFRAEHGLQCGFCTPGMVMATVGLLSENPHPTEVQVREGLEGNLCRCTGHYTIGGAALAAAGAGGGTAASNGGATAAARATGAGGATGATGASGATAAGGEQDRVSA